MKDFMLIFLGVDYTKMELSPEEIQKRATSWMNWQAKMGETGILKEGNALQSGGKIISGSERLVKDKSSTELKEIIGGYYIVKAIDFDGAMQVAQDYPDYDLGGVVEIREVMHYN